MSRSAGRGDSQPSDSAVADAEVAWSSGGSGSGAGGGARNVPEALRGPNEVAAELASRVLEAASGAGGAGEPSSSGHDLPAAATADLAAAAADLAAATAGHGHGHGGDPRRHDVVPEGLRHTSEAAADLANALLQRIYGGGGGGGGSHGSSSGREVAGKVEQRGAGGGAGKGGVRARGDVVPEELRHTSEAAAELANRVLQALSGQLRRGHELRTGHPAEEHEQEGREAAAGGERGGKE